MGRKLEDLKWKPMWVTHLGCIKGCLDYLDLDVSDAWLFGATGHAFVINIHEVVCPSGPTAWNTEMLFKLGRNIGYNINGVFGTKSDRDFADKQERAWENTKRAIDDGLPCYGWELDIPEYYVVYGYDDKGYYFSGPKLGIPDTQGHKPWRELGDTEIGVLEMHWVKPKQAADDPKTLREAFGFALEHSKSPAKWIYPKYKAGLAGWDNWTNALETGKAHGFGMAYNAAVWSECRDLGVEFLKESKERIGGKVASLFDEATGYYETVAQNLKKIHEAFPFPPKGDEVKDVDLCTNALEYLRDAKSAEESGLRTLGEIASQL